MKVAVFIGCNKLISVSDSKYCFRRFIGLEIFNLAALLCFNSNKLNAVLLKSGFTGVFLFHYVFYYLKQPFVISMFFNRYSYMFFCEANKVITVSCLYTVF